MDSKELVIEIAKTLDEKKAENIVAIRTEEVTIISDYFIIASGGSSVHVKSLAEDVEFEIKKRLDLTPDHIEGRATGWILIDYGTVVVHIFQKEDREYYNLERLWADASKIDLSGALKTK